MDSCGKAGALILGVGVTNKWQRGAGWDLSRHSGEDAVCDKNRVRPGG